MQSERDFADSFLGAQREAAASFGVNTILLEKYITRPRHIEVQVLVVKFLYYVLVGIYCYGAFRVYTQLL